MLCPNMFGPCGTLKCPNVSCVCVCVCGCVCVCDGWAFQLAGICSFGFRL